MVAAVRFDRVSRHFGSVRAVDDVSLEIADGEFFAMLGPSGSGKTTCLRLIAGFETPDSGRIALHGHDTLGVPPNRRDVNTVFQDYALFPHMSVIDNIAYGPMVAGVAKVERHRRAEEMLALVQLPDLGGRKPQALSGGQRQRVALARALINRPRVLLLDEPLGALDLKLRERMQVELKALQRKVGITFVYVTHDQQEALSMSDRLAVLSAGRIEQIGTPEEIYEHPASAFVAGFVGIANIVEGALAEALRGTPEAFAIRPEKITLAAPGTVAGGDRVHVAGRIAALHYLGASTRYEVALDGGASLSVTRPNSESRAVAVGDAVALIWAREAMRPLTVGKAKRE